MSREFRRCKCCDCVPIWNAHAGWKLPRLQLKSMTWPSQSLILLKNKTGSACVRRSSCLVMVFSNKKLFYGLCTNVLPLQENQLGPTDGITAIVCPARVAAIADKTGRVRRKRRWDIPGIRSSSSLTTEIITRALERATTGRGTRTPSTTKSAGTATGTAAVSVVLTKANVDGANVSTGTTVATGRKVAVISVVTTEGILTRATKVSWVVPATVDNVLNWPESSAFGNMFTLKKNYCNRLSGWRFWCSWYLVSSLARPVPTSRKPEHTKYEQSKSQPGWLLRNIKLFSWRAFWLKHFFHFLL